MGFNLLKGNPFFVKMFPEQTGIVGESLPLIITAPPRMPMATVWRPSLFTPAAERRVFRAYALFGLPE